MDAINWLQENLGGNFAVDPIKGDASTRKFWRVRADKPYMLMLADKPEHKTPEFLSLARHMRDAGIQVPRIYKTDGRWVLMEDFGSVHYADVLTVHSCAALYTKALYVLKDLQKLSDPLPVFDEAFMKMELSRFTEYYLPLIEVKLLPGLDAFFNMLIKTVAAQPYGVIHRDYHCRNIMMQENQHPGIIDFQDMMQGPLVYDAVSLLEDAYIDFPVEIRTKLYQTFFSIMEWPAHTDPFLAVHETALQRQLKVLGIFAKLAKNGKPGYLEYIPRIVQYMQYHFEHLAWCPPAIKRYFVSEVFPNSHKATQYA